MNKLVRKHRGAFATAAAFVVIVSVSAVVVWIIIIGFFRACRHFNDVVEKLE